MSTSLTSNPYPTYYRDDEPRRWMYGGLAALFVLIGIAIVASVTFPIMRGEMPNWSVTMTPGNWLLQLIAIVVTIWIALWLFRILFRSLAGPSYSPYYRYRYAHRDDYGHWPIAADPSLGIARERFARGEITREQLEQITRDLGHPAA